MSRTKLIWKGDMAFDAELNGHHFFIDAADTSGGKNLGPRPKGLLLSALAGCTGMDVVSILKKMKVQDYSFSIDVSADSTEEHPKTYSKIYLNFVFEGNELPVDKIRRAVELSEIRYCGVSAMLKKSAEIKSRIILNGEEISKS